MLSNLVMSKKGDYRQVVTGSDKSGWKVSTGLETCFCRYTCETIHKTKLM